MTQNRKKILVADDNAAHRKTICLGLGRKGHETIEAENGAQAVEMAAAEQPDAVVMDFMMPVLNGIEATKRLRADDATAEIPVLMLTVINEQRLIIRGLLSGVSDYVIKGSMSIQELVSRIECLIEAYECSAREDASEGAGERSG